MSPRVNSWACWLEHSSLIGRIAAGIHAASPGIDIDRSASCSPSTSSTKCWWSARRNTNIRFGAGARPNSSRTPSSGTGVSSSAARCSAATSRVHPNTSVSGKIPGFGFPPPPGASATTARTRGSTSGTASTVQPPKLCPASATRSWSSSMPVVPASR